MEMVKKWVIRTLIFPHGVAMELFNPSLPKRSKKTSLKQLFSITSILLLISISITPVISGDSNDEESDWEAIPLEIELPTPIYQASTVWTGEHAFIFAGRNESGPVNSIYRFTPQNGELKKMSAKFPTPRIMSSAAWVEPYAYIFGGGTQANFVDEIIRYDPLKDSLEVLDTQLPIPQMGSSAISDGEDIFIFGGRNQSEHIDRSLRFDPKTEVLESMEPFPIKGGGRSIVWTGENVYLFGGGITGGTTDAIIRFSPESEQYQELDIRLPVSLYWSCAIWSGDSAFIFGGNTYSEWLDTIIEFRPDTVDGDGFTKIVGHFPVPLELASCVYDGDSAYVIGGRSGFESSASIYMIQELEGGGGTSNTSFERWAVPALILSLCSVIIAFFLYKKLRGECGE